MKESLAQSVMPLSAHPPLACGSSRWVYQHPRDPHLLIKVLRHPLPAGAVSGLRNRFMALRSRFKITRHMREIEQYIVVHSSHDDGFRHHLPLMTGLVHTDVGIGISVQAIRDADGHLAPTLLQLLDNRQMTPQRIELLERFFERLLSSRVVVGDLHAGNIVLGSDSGEYFALIDGLGDSTIIATRALSPWINQAKKRQTVKKIRRLYAEGLTA